MGKRKKNPKNRFQIVDEDGNITGGLTKGQAGVLSFLFGGKKKVVDRTQQRKDAGTRNGRPVRRSWKNLLKELNGDDE